uniref:Uncharacterized protein n=1 Tax=Opuntia streptacantha TaxID=393608 RepID=A0A7C9AW62_OPUST
MGKQATSFKSTPRATNVRLNSSLKNGVKVAVFMSSIVIVGYPDNGPVSTRATRPDSKSTVNTWDTLSRRATTEACLGGSGSPSLQVRTRDLGGSSSATEWSAYDLDALKSAWEERIDRTRFIS